MEKIKVNKTELLSILESNRSKHRQIFEEACDGYQKLEAQLKRANWPPGFNHGHVKQHRDWP